MTPVFTIVCFSHAPTARYRHVTTGPYHVTTKTADYSWPEVHLSAALGQLRARVDTVERLSRLWCPLVRVGRVWVLIVELVSAMLPSINNR